jgi:hypothetical protein
MTMMRVVESMAISSFSFLGPLVQFLILPLTARSHPLTRLRLGLEFVPLVLSLDRFVAVSVVQNVFDLAHSLIPSGA